MERETQQQRTAVTKLQQRNGGGEVQEVGLSPGSTELQ